MFWEGGGVFLGGVLDTLCNHVRHWAGFIYARGRVAGYFQNPDFNLNPSQRRNEVNKSFISNNYKKKKQVLV